MLEIVPQDSRYTPLTQQVSCCVPTCIQIVMLRHRIPLIPAELLGYHLGLVVADDKLKYFWNARTGARPPSGYGTQIHKKEYNPNAVFKKLKIPLKMTWTLIDKFKNIEEFRKYIEQVEKNDKDVLICYDWPTLFDPSRTDHWGHVCVLDRFFKKADQVRFIDPDDAASKWITVEIQRLFAAMKFHGKEKSAGFWELEKR